MAWIIYARAQPQLMTLYLTSVLAAVGAVLSVVKVTAPFSSV
jgi:hypothetical protein